MIPSKHPLPTIEDITAEFHSFFKVGLETRVLTTAIGGEECYLTVFVTHWNIPIQKDAVQPVVGAKHISEGYGNSSSRSARSGCVHG